MGTLSKIATHLDISISTVSRCLNNDSSLHITEDTRASIYNYAKEIGYIDKKSKTNPTILIYFYTDENDDRDPFYGLLKEETIKYCEDNNINYVFFPRYKIPNYLVNIQGIVAIGTLTDEEMDLLGVLSKNITFINSFPDLKYFDSVVVDDRSALKRVVGYFAKNNVKKLYFIGASEYVPGTLKPKFNYRHHFFDYYIDNYNIENAKSFIGEYSYDSGYNRTKEFLDDLPSGIICASDTIAKGCIDCLLEHNIKIPEEVEVFGFNNDDSSINGKMQISTIEAPIIEMSKVAIDNTIDNLNRKSEIHKRIVLPTRLIYRETTKH